MKKSNSEASSQYPEKKYYKLNESDFTSLRFSGNAKSSSYFVNYCSGEVYDDRQKQIWNRTITNKRQ